MSEAARAVTALFVPGDRPDRFAKAAGAGADLVIVDLEDAVAADAKAYALAAVVDALSPATTVDPLRALVRLTAAGGPTADVELAALSDVLAAGGGLIGVMLPKAEDPAVVARTIERLGGPEQGLAVVPLVESARGVLHAFELASVPGVTRLAFGALDFALDVRAEPGSETGTYARAQLVLACRAAGVAAPLDSPSTEVADTEAVGLAARSARAMGFGGKLCIHPAQLAAVRAAFRPTTAEVEWARAVVDAGDGAVQIDGRMVDRPLVERARRILAAAD